MNPIYELNQCLDTGLGSKYNNNFYYNHLEEENIPQKKFIMQDEIVLSETSEETGEKTGEEAGESEALTGEGGEEGRGATFIGFRDIVDLAISEFKLLGLGLSISIFLFILIFFNKTGKQLTLWQKMVIIILPLFLSMLYYWVVLAPKPKKYYFLNVLFGEDDDIPTGFNHKLGGEGSWPYIGSAILNVQGNDYVFLGGGLGQSDALLKYDAQNQKFQDVIENTNLSSDSPTYSALSFDMDKDGLDDLIVGRSDGVFLYKHIKPLKFKKIKLIGELDKSPLALSVSDFNRDGKPDIYVSYFTPMSKYRGSIFNDPSHNRKNILLKNISCQDSDLKFVDVTTQTNSGGLYNTFTSAFIDLNNDSWPDLVLSHDSGEIEILKNEKGKEFTSIFADPYKGNWMGIASGDIDNDGDQDLFLTNIGKDTDKNQFSMGDIKPNQKQTFSHLLLRNDGNFKFTDITQSTGISGEGFGWGALMHDFDNDSNIDLIFGENFLLYAKNWVFPNPGYFYLNQGTNNTDKKNQIKNNEAKDTPNQDTENKDNNQNNIPKFSRQFRYMNHNFAQTPLLADLDKDGSQDIVWVNMYGPSIVYLNKERRGNFINIRLPETVDFVNAKIIVDTPNKSFYRENIQGGLGFGSDSSNLISVGIGKENKIQQVVVNTIGGNTYQVKDPKINSTLFLKDLKINRSNQKAQCF